MTTADPNEKSGLQFFDPEELRKVGLGPLCKGNLFRTRSRQTQEREQPTAPPEDPASAA